MNTKRQIVYIVGYLNFRPYVFRLMPIFNHLEQILAGVEGVIYQGSPFSGSYRKHIPPGVVLERLSPDKIEVLYRIKDFLNPTSTPGRID